MRAPEMVFGSEMRAAVDRGIRGVCTRRSWQIHALNVRTNHVHVVLSAPERPEVVLGALKASGTRSLRKEGLVGPGVRVWTDHGSTRYLWQEQHVESACIYTMEFQ